MQLLVLTLIAMGFTLYKKRHEARRFVMSFLNTEFTGVLEVRRRRLAQAFRLQQAHGAASRVTLQLCLELWDIASSQAAFGPSYLCCSPLQSRLIRRSGEVDLGVCRPSWAASAST